MKRKYKLVQSGSGTIFLILKDAFGVARKRKEGGLNLEGNSAENRILSTPVLNSTHYACNLLT